MPDTLSLNPDLAVRMEAEQRMRTGEITLTQANAMVRSARPDPMARLALQRMEHSHRLAAALRELHSVCLAMDLEDEAKRPTEDEYQAALRQAAAALAEH